MTQRLAQCSQSEARYIARGRQAHGVMFPGKDFDSSIWNTRLLNASSHRIIPNIYFTEYGSQSTPLPSVFARVLKTYVLLNMLSLTNMKMRVDAARLLWLTISRRFDAASFAWRDITETDLLNTETIMLEHLAPNSTSKYCQVLQRMMRDLSLVEGGLVAPLRPAFKTPRPSDSERFLLVEQEARAAALPTSEALGALADIYARYAVEPGDRLLICACAVTLASGLRGGEVLTMPLDCIQREDRRRRLPSGAWVTEESVGLRFAKEKSQRTRPGERSFEIRWLRPQPGALAVAAIAEVVRLTERARQRALVLQQNPDTVPIGYGEHDWLSRDAVAAILGYTDGRSVNAIPAGSLPKTQTGHAYKYLGADVSAYLQSRRKSSVVLAWGINGEPQMLTDSLFLAFANQFDNATSGVCTMLVEPLTLNVWNTFLSGKAPDAAPNAGRVRSVFERLEEVYARDGVKFRELDGTPIRLTSHDFRYWVTTQAAKRSVPDHIIARWQGREHLGDLSAYKLLTQEERIALVKHAVQAGRASGAIADFYFALKEDLRDVWLDDILVAAHVTPLGVCIHDFTISPCPKALNCVRNCKDYLHDTGDPAQRRELILLQRRTDEAVEQVERQRALGQNDLSPDWLRDLKETQDGVNRILEVAAKSDGGVVRPFQGGVSRFESDQTAPLKLSRQALKEAR